MCRGQGDSHAMWGNEHERDEICLEEPRSTVCPHIRPLYAHEIEAGCEVFPCEWERCDRHDGTANGGEYP